MNATRNGGRPAWPWAGSIASSHGSATAAPTPRRSVRRDKCQLLVIGVPLLPLTREAPNQSDAECAMDSCSARKQEVTGSCQSPAEFLGSLLEMMLPLVLLRNKN